MAKIKMKFKELNLRKILSNDKFAVFISVFISFSVWLFLAINGAEGRPVVISDIPVTVTLSENAVEDGLRVFGEQDMTASVSVLGSRLVVGQLSNSDVKVVAKQASNITTPGNYTLELTPQKASLITDYDFVSAVSPGFITIVVDRYREVEFAVEDGMQFQVDPAYFAGTPTFSSPKIKVSGPESEIAKIKKIVAKIEIDEILKTSKTINHVPLIMYDNYGDILSNERITLSAAEVDVKIPILLRKVLPVSVEFTNHPEGFQFSENQIKIDPAELEIAVTQEIVESYNAVKLDPIDFSNISLEQHEFNQPVDIPAGCKNLSNTYSANVKIDLGSFTSKNLQLTNFSFSNQPAGKTCTVTTKSLNVQILGPAEQLRDLKSENLVGVIDLKEKENFTGYTEIPVKIAIDGHTSCWAYGEYNVQVNVAQ